MNIWCPWACWERVRLLRTNDDGALYRIGHLPLTPLRGTRAELHVSKWRLLFCILQLYRFWNPSLDQYYTYNIAEMIEQTYYIHKDGCQESVVSNNCSGLTWRLFYNIFMCGNWFCNYIIKGGFIVNVWAAAACPICHFYYERLLWDVGRKKGGTLLGP